MGSRREEREVNEAARRVAAPDQASAEQLSYTARIQLFTSIMRSTTSTAVQPNRANLESSLLPPTSRGETGVTQHRVPPSRPGRSRTKPGPRPLGGSSDSEESTDSRDKSRKKTVSNYAIKSIADLRLPRDRRVRSAKNDSKIGMEETSIRTCFQRFQEGVTVDSFRSIAYSVGLPLCCFGALHHAVLNYVGIQRQNGRSSGGVTDTDKQGVSQSVFRMFWRDKLRDYNEEARLFNVLQHPRHRAVHVKALEEVILAYLKENFEKTGQSRKLPMRFIGIYAKIATGQIAYRLRGGRSTFGRGELQKAGLCKILLNAERGRDEKLGLENLEKIRRELATACAGGDPNALTLSSLTVYSDNKVHTLTPLCVEMIFARYNIDNKMDAMQFTQFLMAAGNPYSVHAAEYLMPIIDADMDGKIDVMDAQTLFKGKEKLMDDRNIQIGKFEPYWTRLCDQVLSPDSGERDALARSKVALNNPRVRNFVIQTLLSTNESGLTVDP